MSLIRGRIRDRRKYPDGGDRILQKSGSGNRHLHQTLAETAHELGIGTNTLQEDVKLARAVETLPEVKEKIQRGERVVRKNVIAAAKEKEAKGGSDKGLLKSSNPNPVHTRKEIAKAAGVSEDTVRKAEKIIRTCR